MIDVSEIYKKGEVYNFTVKAVFPKFCELTGEGDCVTYLQNTSNFKLIKGQTLRCKVVGIDKNHPLIELVDINDVIQYKNMLTEDKLFSIIQPYSERLKSHEFTKLLLTNQDESTLEKLCHSWIQALLEAHVDLSEIRIECAKLLEESDLLNSCSDSERELFQQRLTLVLELLSYYIKAISLINKDKESGSLEVDAFIDGIFEKLKRSGYIFHPNKNFNILSCIFLLCPQVMEQRIDDLFEIIRNRDVQQWCKEPFRSALMKLLDMFVRENEPQITRTLDSEHLVKRTYQSIATWLLLDSSLTSNSLSRRIYCAKLCIIASYVGVVESDKLLDLAFKNLFGDEAILPPYTIADTNGEYLPFYLNDIANKTDLTIVSECAYHQNNAKLSISKDGIMISPANFSGPTVGKSLIPKSLSLWQNLQVYLEKRPDNMVSEGSTNIEEYKKLWDELMVDVFNIAEKPSPTKLKKRHKVPQIVPIRIVRQDKEDPKKFYCTIEDEIGGEGYIFINDIVEYHVSAQLRHFLSGQTGKPYLFNAEIIDYEDGVFHCSMKEGISEMAQNFYGDCEPVVCSLGSDLQPGRDRIPAVSKEGISVSVGNVIDQPVGKNSVVVTNWTGKGTGTFILNADFIEVSKQPFNIEEAFHELMYQYSVEEEQEETSEDAEEMPDVNVQTLTEQQVKELIAIIDRESVIVKDYIKSYSYLGFARILSLMLGMEEQASYYKGRMDIIVLLNYFAKNDNLSEDQIKELETVNADLFTGNDSMHERLIQLQIVSYLGRTEKNGTLWNLSQSNNAVGRLASLALSYNVVSDNDMDYTATDIHNKIKGLLRLGGYESNLKLYGSGEEDTHTEYKTSVIYYAGEKQTDVVNAKAQTGVIMAVIASFLNTEGGTLYIGTNNAGLGVGLENDLKNEMFLGSKDNYIQYITNNCIGTFGGVISAACINNIHFDSTNQRKDVCIVHVKPSSEGVSCNGKWFVRINNRKKELTEEEFLDFKATYKPSPVSQDMNVAVQEMVVTEVPVISEGNSQPTALFSEGSANKIQTSVETIRKNVLENWQEDYRPTIAFLQFLDGNKFCKITDYQYDPKLLTLAVYEEEEEGYLVLGYNDGTICKVPMSEVLDFDDSRNYTRFSEAELVFASIAKKDDAILRVTKEDKNKNSRLMMRLDSLSQWEDGKLGGKGDRLFNEGLAEEYLLFEVIPHKHIESLSGMLDKSKTTLGVWVEQQGNARMVSVLKSLGVRLEAGV